MVEGTDTSNGQLLALWTLHLMHARDRMGRGAIALYSILRDHYYSGTQQTLLVHFWDPWAYFWWSCPWHQDSRHGTPLARCDTDTNPCASGPPNGAADTGTATDASFSHELLWKAKAVLMLLRKK
ncbi:hypothetical protein NDU88_000218 [Pleurodeles waltl]|uniref:Uncharacterized protein n=1 Tax=Pleurodeles waltl TaxID=8319 RepID=A0AAV7KLP7_PLEWA|nr:hypothetical protein NDU88_000218 [Pleurodeles waltl]